MTLRITLLIGLLGSACSERLPQAPDGCEGVQCGCQEHTDCPIETPECWAGLCRESDSTEVAWAHRDIILPASADAPDSDLHAVDLARAIDLSKDSLIDGLLSEQPITNWRLYANDDGDRLAVHVGGLIMVRPALNKPRIWQPTSRKLTNNGPGVHPDLRAIAGYESLKQTVLSASRNGLLASSSPVRLLNTSEHRVILGKPLHRMIVDLMGPVVPGRPTGSLSIASLSKLMQRGHALPHPRSLGPSFPSRTRPELIIGRNYRFSLEAAADLRIEELLKLSNASVQDLMSCDELRAAHITISIDGGAPQSWSRQDDPFIRSLEAGEHTLSLRYPSKVQNCPNLENNSSLMRWARLTLKSDREIELISWSPVTPLPIDNNARPVLYREDAGLLRDKDGDNWPDASDLCPQDPDQQRDGDQNGIGDACDGFYSARAEEDQLTAVNRNGDELGTQSLPNFNPLLSFQTALTSPQTEITYPDSDEINANAVTGAVIFQTSSDEDVYQWNPDQEPQALGIVPIVPGNTPTQLMQIQSNQRYAAMHFRLLGSLTQLDIQTIVMKNTIANHEDSDKRQVTTRYVYSGWEPAFAVADPSEPLLLVSDQEIGHAAFSAMRVFPAALIRFPSLLLAPAMTQCQADNDCLVRGSHLTENGVDIARTCVRNRCVSDSTSGRCVREAQPTSSTLNACRPEQSGTCITGDCDDNNASCSAGLCWRPANNECAQGETCLPSNLSRSTASSYFMGLMPRGVAGLFEGGYFSPLSYALARDLGLALAAKQLGVVQALPMDREAPVALTACPKEWLDGRLTAYFTQEEQRSLLRRVLDPNVRAQDLFEIAEVDQAWVLQPGDDPPSSICRPIRSTWRGYFPSQLAPQTAEFVDIDKDGINEFRVGFSVLERSPSAEPAVYRCFDFNGDHQATNCTP